LNMLGDILLTLVFVFANGFFVAAEFAIVKVRTAQIELRVREGNVLARWTKQLLANLDAYLSACQLGITLASLGLGWIGEEVGTHIVSAIIAQLGIVLSPAVLGNVTFASAFAAITVLHIVIGEMAPKSYAIRKSETTSLAVAIPLRLFYLLFKPVIVALNWMSNALLRLLGIQPADEHQPHSPEELRYLIAESGDKGALEVSERELIENVFEFTETTASQIMVPRSRIVAIDITLPVEEVLDKVMEEGYSRLPVFSGSIDTILGIVYAKDLLTLMHHKNLIIVQDILHPVFFVQEDTMIQKLLAEMQAHRSHMVVVHDEFGGTAGLVTLENIMEELVGNIQDEYDDEAPMFETTTTNVFEIETSVHIDEVNEQLPLPLPKNEEFETIGGLINATAGKILQVNDAITLGVYECVVLEATPRRVLRVRLTLPMGQ
jgi:CBS domain containing-hemolysin-like protein